MFVRMKNAVNKLWSTKISSSTFAFNVDSDLNRKQIYVSLDGYNIGHCWVYCLYLDRYDIFIANVSEHILDDQIQQSPVVAFVAVWLTSNEIEIYDAHPAKKQD